MGDNKLGKEIIAEDGQYDLFLPDEEIQAGRRMESMNCTRFGLLNAIEILAKIKYGKNWNRSDRYNGGGVTQNGSTMSSALDSVRKYYGTVDEKVWPVDWDNFTWNEYYKAIPGEIRQLGLGWLKEYEVGFERVPQNINLIKEALKYSPLYVSGFAWYESRGLYRSYGQANHCFTVYGYEEQKCLKAFDSYPPYKKQLDWNYQFGTIYAITLKKKSIKYNEAEIKKLMQRGIKYIIRVFSAGEVYELQGDKLVKVEPQEIKDITIRNLSEAKKLIGITEQTYNKLTL